MWCHQASKSRLLGIGQARVEFNGEGFRASVLSQEKHRETERATPILPTVFTMAEDDRRWRTARRGSNSFLETESGRRRLMTGKRPVTAIAAHNKHDRGDCTPSSTRSNTGGCCARVAERRPEQLGLPIYIWAGSCASAAPRRREKKCVCYGSAGLLAEIGEDRVGFQPVATVQHEKQSRPTLENKPAANRNRER
jgi:hypothetical protein